LRAYPIVDVHVRGLAFKGANDTRSEVFFEDIDSLYFDADPFLGSTITLRTLERREHVIPSNLQGLRAIIQMLDRHVTVPLTKTAKEALVKGEHLHFGPVSLEVTEIVVKGEKLDYRRLASVAAEDHVLVFYQTIDGQEQPDRFAWVKVRDIPHPKVLLDVLTLRTNVVLRGFEI